MTVMLKGRKDRRRKGVVVCGGPSVKPGLGCGAEASYTLDHTCSDKVAEIRFTGLAIKDGWTSDFPSFGSALIGHSHLCPECSPE